MQAVAPVQPAPPHCPYRVWVELPLPEAVVVVDVVVVTWEVVVMVLVLVVNVVEVTEVFEVVDPAAVVLVVVVAPPVPVTGVPDAVMLEEDCVMETAPL